MILLDKPYVSKLLKDTIIKNNFPFSDLSEDKSFDFENKSLKTSQAVDFIKKNNDFSIYTTSENSIGWINKNLDFTNLGEKIDIFKNKVKFRNLIKKNYPDYFFKEIKFDELFDTDPVNLEFPLILKPSTGFFSMGVYKVSDKEKWVEVLNKLKNEIKGLENIYPPEVMATDSFIVEKEALGDEFAVDAYFDNNGKPVILGIYKHLFSGDHDVSDRVYISSKEIIEENINEFSLFLEKTGNLAQIKNFPVHAELKKDNNTIIPVEINPMRFGGWCSTADMTYYSYGFNPYEYYFFKKKPDWNEILKDKKDKIFSIIVLDNSTGVEASKIKSFDYNKLLNKLSSVLEYRKIDYTTYPVFGFIFAQSDKNNMEEIYYLLNSTLNEFIEK
jgi:hypothetical protein